jgi:hypothetical protein
MERYKNLGRDSGVTGYELGDGSITVQFDDGSRYRRLPLSLHKRKCRSSQHHANAAHGAGRPGAQQLH